MKLVKIVVALICIFAGIQAQESEPIRTWPEIQRHWDSMHQLVQALQKKKNPAEIQDILKAGFVPSNYAFSVATRHLNEYTPQIINLLFAAGGTLEGPVDKNVGHSGVDAMIWTLLSDQDASLQVLAILLERGGYQLVDEWTSLADYFATAQAILDNNDVPNTDKALQLIAQDRRLLREKMDVYNAVRNREVGLPPAQTPVIPLSNGE